MAHELFGGSKGVSLNKSIRIERSKKSTNVVIERAVFRFSIIPCPFQRVRVRNERSSRGNEMEL